MVPDLTSSDNFGRKGWTAQLAVALRELGKAQQPYLTDIGQQCTFLDIIKKDDTPWRKSEHLSTVLCSLYGQPDQIPPLRNALRQVRRLLTAHPCLVGVLDPSSDHDELWIQDVTIGGTEYLRGIISGLMVRAEEHSQDGYATAVHELCMLLEPKAEQRSAGCCDPSVGYHVVLLRGLRLDHPIPVEDDIRIVPLDEIEDFINRKSLYQMPLASGGQSRDFAAIVKPFHWRPQLLKSQADATWELPDTHDFLDDAEGFVELLAVLHESPVVCLAKIAVCKNRIACLLLGRTHSIGGFTYGRSGQSFRWPGASPVVKPEVFERACQAFRNRDSQRYKDCAPIIGRLSEALSRGGRYGVTDKLLDVAIALERMYQLDGGEIMYKLRTRAAFFLAPDPDKRLRIFHDLGDFYKMRSSIIHGRRNDKAAPETFCQGFHIAKRTVDKLLECGFPDNWDDIVIAGTNPPNLR